MTLARLRAHLLAFPHVTTNVQWGGSHVFRIGPKIFAVNWEGGVSFKVERRHLADWLDREGVRLAPYLGRFGWVHADLTATGLKVGLRESYELIRAGLPRRVRAQLA